MKRPLGLWLGFAAALGVASRLAAWALRRTPPAQVAAVDPQDEAPSAVSPPDRRSGIERRSGKDRRQAEAGEPLRARILAAADRRSGEERRSGRDRRVAASSTS
jgi:hypothetical protein